MKKFLSAMLVIIYLIGVAPNTIIGFANDTEFVSFGNILNKGFACEYDNNIYFSNENDGGKLYRTNMDSKIEKIDDDNANYINIAKYKLYYISFFENI